MSAELSVVAPEVTAAPSLEQADPAPSEFVLVVDDDPGKRYLVSRALRERQLASMEVATGAEALRKARELRPLVIVLDVKLPDTSGFDLCQELKNDPLTSTIPVVLQSAVLRTELDRINGLECGADAFFADVLSPEEFAANVHAFARLSRAERARELERQQLRESEERYRRTFEQAAVGVAHLSIEGQWLRVNPGLCRMLGYTEAELLQRTFQELTHPEDLPQNLELYRRLLAGELPSGVVEKRYFRKDGTIAWAQVTISLGEDRPNSYYFISIIEDIGEKKQREEDARRRVEFEQQLIGIVSHDLRNPIAAITLSAAMLLRRNDLTDRQATATNRILSSADRATRMIRDLLDFTKARLGGGIEIRRSAMDLHEVTQQVVDELAIVFPERTIQTEADGEGAGEWDSDRLSQVIANLLRNALTYGDPAQPVTVRTRGREGAVLLEIHNWGPPIPPDKLPRIFEPMQRASVSVTKESRSVGLGLYIVRHLVSAHGGKLSVTSNEAEGTRFSVWLPKCTQSSTTSHE